MTGERRPHIVIVGAGFGGLEAAKALAGTQAEVTVIDRQNHHCFQPLLYQVASAALSPADVAWPIRSILGRHPNISVLMAEVTGIDRDACHVHSDVGDIPYDHLILATGATHSYFGNPEWEGVAPGLKTIEDATEIRRRILLAFERAEATSDPVERERLLTFVVIGGGPTGVEMAGAIAEIARDALPLDFRHVDPRTARVVLVEAGPRLLAALPEHLADYVARALAAMRVELVTGQPVTHCDTHGVALGERRIEAATIIWAAGVIASPAARWLGVEKDKAGRVRVSPDLSLPDDRDIFVIGDTAAITDGKGKPVPGLAPAAKQAGAYVGRLLAARIAGRTEPGPFIYRHQGDLATVGRKAAVVRIGRIELKGLIGWLFWSFVHIHFLVGRRNRWIVGIHWAWNFITFQRSARLITGAAASSEEPILADEPTDQAPQAAQEEAETGPPADAAQELPLRRRQG
ncbi:NAD(P)/FAD-dependent oxidoreductase [Niveispirillum irakense]|uniref:NAD(P)/FAD-dependent oxidoreductase n=1 Tax=Niveispirillum irakense TaxID=34011 RepID=UPI0003F6FBCC|nr:NAD(P)/FAD-dependent oxidoreductase [Niveispirillum irakense]